ncbi:MAG: EAL domain-containing protein [Oscillospiraceae bacterium]|nr:EAL domain-containing protein [Oscillospiraceae bacterium]
MSMDIFELFSGAKSPAAILEYLDGSAYDGLSEVDLRSDRLHVLFRSEGKYAGPVQDSAYSEFRSYAGNRFVHPEDRNVYFSLTEPETLERRFAESKYPGILSAQYRLLIRGGGYRWVEQTLVYGEQFGLKPGIMRDYHFDIQLQKNRRLGLALSSEGKRKRDEVTGLLVGDSFFPAAQAMLSIPTDKGRWSLLFISIEHLKLFREWFGKETANELLSRLGAVLRQEASETSGLAGHLWDDDFLLLTPYDMERTKALYEKLHDEIKVYGIPVGFLPVIGVSVEREGGTVLSMADRAGVAAASLRGNFRVRIGQYRPEMGDRTREEYRILSEVQQAMQNREFSFVLQPQCRMVTGKIVGAEALIRWRKADGTMVPPGDFIPVLERYGFISELDKLIWRRVCSWLRSWVRKGHEPVPISVNISQADILTFDVPEYLDSLIRHFELPRDSLKLEITESAYVSEMETVRNAVHRFRELGFRVLMDDFGSGYSSLNMLNSLGVDVVKLDAHFLHLEEGDERGRQILEAVIDMTRRLSLPIIVEGVETEEHVRFLRSLGCRYVQGYYFYKPMPVSEFEALIGDEENVDREGIVYGGVRLFHIREFLERSIYNDVMLNNIIGAVAFYAWDGEGRVDIIRYNEVFRDVVADPDFDNRLTDILNYLHPDDRAFFLRLMKTAYGDSMGGASGVIRVYRATGELGRFLLRLYYLEEQAVGKVFYGSLHELRDDLPSAGEGKALPPEGEPHP